MDLGAQSTAFSVCWLSRYSRYSLPQPFIFSCCAASCRSLALGRKKLDEGHRGGPCRVMGAGWLVAGTLQTFLSHFGKLPQDPGLDGECGLQ